MLDDAIPFLDWGGVLDLRLAPTPDPDVFPELDIYKYLSFSGETAIMDLQARLANAYLRQKTRENINFRFGSAMFRHTSISSLNVLTAQMAIVLSITLLSIATLSTINFIGLHFVTDRQSGLRRQLFLNGVVQG